MSDDDRPLVTNFDDGVLTIRFNRPAVHNAQNVAMLERFDEVMNSLRWNREIRVVVLAGNGPSFCSGHDLSEMGRNDQYRQNASTAEGRYWQELRLFYEPIDKLKNLPIPTVCLVQGYCLAAGLMFAAASDFVVATSSAVFGSPIVSNMAINDAESATVLHAIGPRRAKRLLWLGERIDADTAREWSLVDWVVPEEDLDTKAADIVHSLLQCPPEALSLSKDSLLFLEELQGSRSFNRYHYLSHQLSHQTAEARQRLDDRLRRLEKGESK